MEMVFTLFLLIVFSIFGSILGLVTGMLPGIHVNMVALLLLVWAPLIVESVINELSLVNDVWLATILICVVILSASVVHTFVDFIPSIFFGAPDEDTVLSVLPGHQMLLKGQGYKAVVLSAYSSFMATILSFSLLIPAFLLIGEPLNLYVFIKRNIFWLLVVVVSFLLLSENGGREKDEKRNFSCLTKVRDFLKPRFKALFLFLLSGSLGLVIYLFPLSGVIELRVSALFSALTGLFGVSTLFLSILTSPKLPKQHIPKKERRDYKTLFKNDFLKNSLKGTIAGSVVGFLPGVSSSHAAVISSFSLKRKKRRNECFIVVISSINTANAFFCLVALFLILRPRNGAVIAINKLLMISESGNGSVAISPEFFLLLIGVLVASLFGLYSTLFLGKVVASRINSFSYKKTMGLVLIVIFLVVYLFTGFYGLVILLVSALVGLLPPLLGVRRSHLMGVLLFPVIVYFSPF